MYFVVKVNHTVVTYLNSLNCVLFIIGNPLHGRDSHARARASVTRASRECTCALIGRAISQRGDSPFVYRDGTGYICSSHSASLDLSATLFSGIASATTVIPTF